MQALLWIGSSGWDWKKIITRVFIQTIKRSCILSRPQWAKMNDLIPPLNDESHDQYLLMARKKATIVIYIWMNNLITRARIAEFQWSIYLLFICLWSYIWVRSRRCGRPATWSCYQLIAKPDNKTAPRSRPDPYLCVKFIALRSYLTGATAAALRRRPSSMNKDLKVPCLNLVI